MSAPEEIKHKTTVQQCDDGWTEIVYYKTAIVRFNNETIVLNTGGYKTATTQSRMNFVSRKFNLGYLVRRPKQNWTVEYEGQTVAFDTAAVRLNRVTGEVTSQ